MRTTAKIEIIHPGGRLKAHVWSIHLDGKETIMKTINIYLTKEQKKKADKVRIKYKVSLSTIAGIVAYELANRLIKCDRRDYLEKLQEDYLQKNGTYKTSIKPREILNGALNGIQKKNLYTTNALIIYLDGKVREYLDNENCNKYYAQIDKKLNEAYDIYWDYNSNIRQQRRMIKQNKEYWKKVLEENE